MIKDMSNTKNKLSIFHLIAAMADVRREYAKEHGFEVSEEEIADDIKSSLIRMMQEADEF